MPDTLQGPREIPTFLRVGDDDIFGILTRPTTPARGVAVLSVWGSGDLPGGAAPSFGRNRMRVRLARRAAAAGYHAMRFDYAANGESAGTSPATTSPELPGCRPEILAAATWLQQQGVDRLVLVGASLAASSVLAAASQLNSLVGLVLLTPILLGPRDMRMAFKEKESGGSPKWIDDRIYDDLRRAFDRRIPLLIMYGTEDWPRKVFEHAKTGRLGRLLEEATVATVGIVDGLLYHEGSVAAQESAIDVVTKWLEQRDRPDWERLDQSDRSTDAVQPVVGQ